MSKKLQTVQNQESSFGKSPSQPSESGKILKLPREVIQEVIGAQQFVIAEYLTRVLLRSVQEVIRLQHFDISKEAERLGATVTSESGWNRKNSALFKYFRSGISVTAGAAHVYNGAPHIHNKSWWDDTVLYPALMSGYTLGEALFANQLHIGWITTFIGDPLLRYSQAYKTSDNRLPVNPEQNVRFRIVENAEGKDEVWLLVDSSETNGSLYQAQAQAKDRADLVTDPTFTARPALRLGDKSVCGETWTLSLMNPFGSTTTVDVVIDCQAQ